MSKPARTHFLSLFFALSDIASNLDLAESVIAPKVESTFLMVVSAEALMVSAADFITESALLTTGSEPPQLLIAMIDKTTDSFFIAIFIENKLA